MDVALTSAQREALVALHQAGGTGVIGKTGRIVAGGERLPQLPDTFLRLLTFGCIEVGGPNRLTITEAGRALAARPTRKIDPRFIRGSNAPLPAAKGAE